jgi:hypothetical protein
VLDVELIVLRPDSRPEDGLRVVDAAARLGAGLWNVLGYDSDEGRLPRVANGAAATRDGELPLRELVAALPPGSASSASASSDVPPRGDAERTPV